MTFSAIQLPRYLFPALAALVCAVIVMHPVADYDLYWHLALGREMVGQWRIVNEEIFSFTHAGTVYSNHEWLAQVLMYLVHNAGGMTGVAMADLALSMSVVALVYVTSRRLGAAPPVAAALTCVAIFVGTLRYNFRPEIFSLLFVALFGWVLHSYRVGAVSARVLVVVPVALGLWDWLHGAVFGVVLLAAFAFGENIKRWIGPRLPALSGVQPMPSPRLRAFNLWMLVTLAAWAVNPYGMMSYDIFFEFFRTNALVGMVEEFDASTWATYPEFFVLIALSAALALWRWRHLEATSVICALPFVVLALRHQRAGAVAALVLVPLLAILIAQLHHTRRRMLGSVGLVTCVVVAVAFVYSYRIARPSFAAWFGVPPVEDYSPVGSARFIVANNVTGNMYNTGDLGGYLAFELYPARRIFQFNHHYIFGDTLRYARDPGSLRPWNISYAVVSTSSELTNLFPRNEWAPVFREPGATLVLRRTDAHRELILRHELRYFSPLLSDDKLIAMASDPFARERVIGEIEGYLKYRPDARVCSILRTIQQRSGLPLANC